MKWTKTYLPTFLAFTQDDETGTRLASFQKRRFQSFTAEILRTVSLLGDTFIFTTPMEKQNYKNFQTSYCLCSCCPFRKLSITILTMLLLQVCEKFYNLDYQSFETDLN